MNIHDHAAAPAPAVGDTLAVTIASIAYRGSGVARHAGWVLFVPGVLAGENVTVRVRRVRRRFVETDLVRVDTPSPHRLDPESVLEGIAPAAVPGCIYAHMAYAEELRAKQAQLADFLVRGGLCEAAAVQTIVASPKTAHYRNKIVLHAQHDARGQRLGYVGADHRTVVDLPFCPLADASINHGLQAVREAPGFKARAAAHDRLTLRCTPKDGTVVWWDRGEPGAPPLTETTLLGEVQVPRGAFFQVNPAVGDALLDRIRAEMSDLEPDAVLDLYCGVGLFALVACALGIPTVIGADRDPQAIASAQVNARRRSVRPRWLATDAGSVARTQLARLPADRTCVILDPPRTGLDAGLRAALLQARPRTLLYVSCAPDTLTRDLKALAAAGYRLRKAIPLDMFPRTAHFETLVRVERSVPD